MPYFVCENCGARFGGWGVGDTCDKCGSKLKEVSEEKLEKVIKDKDKEKEEKVKGE